MAAKRPAQIVAVSLNVLCPYCGDPQPNPNTESDIWLPEEVKTEAAKDTNRTCNACDAKFMLFPQMTVQVG